MDLMTEAVERRIHYKEEHPEDQLVVLNSLGPDCVTYDMYSYNPSFDFEPDKVILYSDFVNDEDYANESRCFYVYEEEEEEERHDDDEDSQNRSDDWEYPEYWGEDDENDEEYSWNSENDMDDWDEDDEYDDYY